jgi:NAD-dependent SIR2 family protein deacetylase/tetratricopeptide (TPR) repeat protein
MPTAREGSKHGQFSPPLKRHEMVMDSEAKKDFRKDDLETITEDLYESLLKGEVAIFVGAGISKDSGLPLASDLMRTILKELALEGEIIDDVLNSNIPFEAFMESFSFFELEKLFDLFLQGEPNVNHFLIGRLVKEGCINSIMTTNFDILLEKAFKKVGLTNDKYGVHHVEDDLTPRRLGGDSRVNLFKIHGSADDPKSVRAVMYLVAARSLTKNRQELVKWFFSQGVHKKVLIMGYNCRDEFDINPAISAIQRSEKRIILIEHNKNPNVKPKIEDISLREENNPFRNFRGKRINYNTGNFVKRLCDLTGFKESVPVSTTNWEVCVREWANGLAASLGDLKYLVATNMFAIVENTPRILYCLNKLKKTNWVLSRKDFLFSFLPMLWGAYKGNSDETSAHDIYQTFGERVRDLTHDCCSQTASLSERVLKVVPSLHTGKVRQTRILLGIGMMIISEGEIEEIKHSLDLFQHVRKLTEEIDDVFLKNVFRAGCWFRLGVAYMRLGTEAKDNSDVKEAMTCFDKSAAISKQIGNVTGEAIDYRMLGSFCIRNRRHKEGIRYLRKSLDLSLKLKDRVLEAENCLLLGRTYLDLALLASAPRSQIPEQSVGHFDDILYDRKENLSKAIEYLGRALNIYRNRGLTKDMSITQALLAKALELKSSKRHQISRVPDFS